MTDESTTDQITKLTQKWCKYVELIPHKDRDKKFNIWIEWKYDRQPTYHSYHQSFIGGMFESEAFATLDEAEKALLENIKSMISDQKMIADEVLANPTDYDDALVNQAKQYDKIFAETIV